MSKPLESDVPSAHAVELFQAHPNVLYSLDTAAYLAGVHRRSILIYCRAGLVRPVVQPPYGVIAFTEETIRTIRQVEYMRAVHGVGIAWIKTMFELLEEVDRLRTEIRFLRDH